ncbi:MAG: sigma-70 family RNA polymerase sigma factor [Kiritimatiellaeota bacterium]|nr:sigma-70 family RNA polymerase sigma factor [Kiritimatiellota bacterium]
MSENVKERDFELIERFTTGNAGAFERLVELYAARAYQIAYGLLGNRQDAEEVVQDAFLKAHKKLPEFRGDSSFSTWFYRIITNLSRNRYHWNRRRGAEVNISMSASFSDDADAKLEMEIPDKALNPQVLLQRKETESALERSLRALPENLREVLVLRHTEEMSYAEMASMLGCELGTVKSRLARAREVLRKNYYATDAG